MCYYSFLFFSRKKMLRFAELMWVKKKGGVCWGLRAAIRPEVVIDGYFVSWGLWIIYATTLLLLHTHTHSLIHIYLYLSLQNEALPQPSDANNNRERRYVAAQSLAVIHVDRTPTTTCLSFSPLPHPHTLRLLFTTPPSCWFVSVLFSHPRGVVVVIVAMFRVFLASFQSSFEWRRKETKQKNKRQVKRIHIVCVCVCPCECVCVW
jgi:hypothetical protein